MAGNHENMADQADDPACSRRLLMTKLRTAFLLATVVAVNAPVAARAQAQRPAVPVPSGPTPPAQAQTRRAAGFEDIEELNLDDLLDTTVSISAGRLQRIEEAPSIVSVVTDEDIRRLGAQTLDEVLRTVPGFDVLTDSTGRNRIAVRGVATGGFSENVLILFNGHRLNDDLHGGATLVNLEIPLYNVKKIEIIRGPGSALFGTDAFLGVVNLVSYTAQNVEGIEILGDAGSFASQRYGILAGHSGKDWGAFASVQVSDTDGPALLVPADAQTAADRLFGQVGLPAVSLAPDRTDSSRRGVDASANATYKGLTLNARVRDEQGGAFIGRIDSFGQRNRLDTQHVLLDATQKITLGPRWSLAANLGYTQARLREDLSPTPPGFSRFVPDGSVSVFPDGVMVDYSINSRGVSGGVQADARISDRHQLTLGTGYLAESTFDLFAAGNFDVFTGAALPTIRPLPFTVVPLVSRQVTSLFALDTWKVLPSVGLTAGVRYDHYNDFGNTVNPRAGVVWRLPQHLNLKVLYGRAFRAPTITELYFHLPTGLEGNRNLTPSVINTVEAALGYKVRNFRAGATYFSNRIRDFLVTTRPLTVEGILGTTTFENSAGLVVQGLELDVHRSFGLGHDAFASYVYQRPEDRVTHQRADGMPAHIGTIGLSVDFGKYVSVSPTLLARGQRPRAAVDPRSPLPAYSVLNVNMRLRQLFDRIEVNAIIDNVLDTRYSDPSVLGGVPGDYPRPGRQASIGFSCRF